MNLVRIETGEVLRFAKVGYVPSGARVLPIPEAFVPSSEDKKHPPVRLSVWDLALASWEAVQKAHVADGATKLPFEIAVKEIERIGRDCGHELSVVSDPLPRSELCWEAHAAILGLHRTGEERKLFKKIRSELVLACRCLSSPGD